MIHRSLAPWLARFLSAYFLTLGVSAAEIDDARRDFIAGNYSRCLNLCEKAVKTEGPSEAWQLLLTECQLMLGQYPEAQATITDALDRHASSVKVRWLGYQVLRQCGRPELANSLPGEILSIVNTSPGNYRDAASLVAVGKAAIRQGADPKQILEKIYDQAKRRDPEYRETYLAAGELALEKNDFELAASQFREGLKKFPDDPDFYFGLARAYAPSDARELNANLEQTLDFNPHHIGGLLLLVDHMIDGEEYAEASKNLNKVLAINPWHPEAWAYRAVLQFIANDTAGLKESHDKALHFWATNPGVDALIGQKLSRKYRFSEGSGYQREALRLDAEYLPAKIQLAQDLLRLGEETEGWKLAEDVFQRDAYDVVAYNLTTLKDTLSQFQFITNGDFIVRMSKREAAIYGPKVLELLNRAKTALGEKYGIKIQTPVIVEVFPESKDFAVRTFGMPGESGYLGVCFGRVITANSPARPGTAPANWESMLWHEFTHVITLQMTGNKIPRWLSEGISVYEERQANPSWGQRMDPRLREAILGGKLKKMTHLSAAFLTPKDPYDVPFAYFESSLAAEFLISRYGLDSMKSVLADMSKDVDINKALEAHTSPISKLEDDFAAYATEQAKNLGSQLDWEKLPTDLAGASMRRRFGAAAEVLKRIPQDPNAVKSDTVQKDPLEEWIGDHPNNYWALKELARKRISAKKWEEAKAPLEKLIELDPEDIGAENPYSALAHVHHQLNETNREEEVLSKLAVIDDTALDAYARLMDLGTIRKDWTSVLTNAERYLAVHPMSPPPYRAIALASEATNKPKEAIQAYRLLLQLDPPDPAETHFRLARLLDQTGDPGAKRQVLQALEDAPRFRDAHRLLLKITAPPSAQPAPDVSKTPVEAETNNPAIPAAAKQSTLIIEGPEGTNTIPANALEREP